MPLLWFSLFFLAGILLADLCSLTVATWLTFTFITLLLLALRFFIPRLVRGDWLRTIPASAATALGFLLALSLGAIRYQSIQPDLDDADFIAAHRDSEGEVVLRGVIREPPDVRDAFIYVRVESESISLEEGQPFMPVHGLVLARLPVQGAWHYGDRVQLRGTLQTPPESEAFSYRQYLARHGIYAVMPYATPTRLPWGSGNPLLAALYALKERANEVVGRLWHDPQGALLAGILLGNESGIPRSLWEDFQNSGTAHIVAISGFNIALVSGLLVRLFGRWFGRRRGALAAGIGIGLYALLVGADAPVVRAALMGGLSLLAAEVGRRQHGLNSLAFVAALMAAINPNLLWDAGFQLSFTATLGLVLYAERFSQAFTAWVARHLPADLFQRLASPISEYLLVTLAAQLTSLPIMLLLFQRFSPISLLANLVVLPAQPPLMILSALATLLGLIWLPLGRVASLLAYPFVAFTIGSVEFFGGIREGMVFVGENALGVALAWYGVLFGVTFGKKPIDGFLPALKPSLVLSAMGVVAALLWQAVFRASDGRLHVFLFDVGNGEAILVQTPSGRYALINGGGSLSKLSASLGRRLPWFHAGLDVLVVANPQEEHIAALPRLVEHYLPGSVLWAGRTNASRSAAALYSALQAERVPLSMAEAGSTLDLGQEARLRVLCTNRRGAIILLEWGNFRALLPLGITFEDLESLKMGLEIAPVTALLLAESGYAPANPAQWVENLSPQVILLSVASGDEEGRPSEETLAAIEGYNILRTDQNGWIHLTTDGQRLWIEAERR